MLPDPLPSLTIRPGATVPSASVPVHGLAIFGAPAHPSSPLPFESAGLFRRVLPASRSDDPMGPTTWVGVLHRDRVTLRRDDLVTLAELEVEDARAPYTPPTVSTVTAGSPVRADAVPVGSFLFYVNTEGREVLAQVRHRQRDRGVYVAPVPNVEPVWIPLEDTVRPALFLRDTDEPEADPGHVALSWAWDRVRKAGNVPADAPIPAGARLLFDPAAVALVDVEAGEVVFRSTSIGSGSFWRVEDRGEGGVWVRPVDGGPRSLVPGFQTVYRSHCVSYPADAADGLAFAPPVDTRWRDLFLPSRPVVDVRHGDAVEAQSVAEGAFVFVLRPEDRGGARTVPPLLARAGEFSGESFRVFRPVGSPADSFVVAWSSPVSPAVFVYAEPGHVVRESEGGSVAAFTVDEWTDEAAAAMDGHPAAANLLTPRQHSDALRRSLAAVSQFLGTEVGFRELAAMLAALVLADEGFHPTGDASATGNPNARAFRRLVSAKPIRDVLRMADPLVLAAYSAAWYAENPDAFTLETWAESFGIVLAEDDVPAAPVADAPHDRDPLDT